MKSVRLEQLISFRYSCIAISFSLFGAALLPALLLRDSDLASVAGNTQTMLYNAIASLTLFFAARRSREYSLSTSAAWMILALAQVSYLIADVIYLFYANVLQIEPYPSPADVFYLLYYPIFLAAIYHFPAPRQTRPEKYLMIFQMMIVVMAAALFTWYFLVTPLVAHAGTPPMELATSVAYPTFDLLLVLAILLLIFRQSDTTSPIPLALLMGGGVVTVGADYLYSFTSLQEGNTSGGLIDLAYQTSYILFAMAGISQALHGRERLNQAQNRHYLAVRNLLHALTPNLWLAAVFVLLIFSHQPNDERLFQEVSIWVGAIIAVAIVFQMGLFLENRRLTANLTVANADLEARVEARTRELAEANTALNLEMQERSLTSEALIVSREKYRAMVEDLPVLVCSFRPDSAITFVNASYCRYFNRSAEELLGRPFLEMIPVADRAAVEAHYLSLTPETPTAVQEHRVIAADGSLRWQRWIDRAIYDGDRLIEYQSIGEDVTERRNAQEALRESEKKFRDLFDNSTDLIQIIAPDGQIVFVNNAWREAMGYSSVELQKVMFWDLLDPRCRPQCTKHFETALSGQAVDNLEAVFVNRLGEPITVEGNINCSLDAEGRPQHLRGIFHNITERKKAEARLVQQAYHDALTGLPNRAMFMQRLANSIASQPGRCCTCAVLFLDLDNFKYINDSLGHTAGDQLLTHIGSRLLGCVRANDMVARLGGDEFVFLLERIADPGVAIQAAERILDILRTPTEILGHLVSVSGSIGVVLGDRIHDVEGALRDADIAMYQAKNLGKNRHFVFEPSLRASPIEHMLMENDLRQALDRNELRVYYQPVLRLTDRTLMGFEALLRWQHHDRGLLRPIDFIPLAEETGLIVPIGEWTLKSACRQLHHWQSLFGGARRLTMSVNLSARQLIAPGLVDVVRAAVAENGLEPTSLALELTESAILEDAERARTVLSELSAMGISIFLDDFGTGYSSLARLQHLPIDAIKIDRSFIQSISPTGENLEILRAMTALGKELRLDVIAEGIERGFHLDRLAEIGCNLGQGFFFSQPAPAETIEAMYLAGSASA